MINKSFIKPAQCVLQPLLHSDLEKTTCPFTLCWLHVSMNFWMLVITAYTFELYKSYSRYKLVPVDVDRVHTFWGQDHLHVGLEILSNAKLDDMRMEQQSQKFVADGKKWVQENFIIFNQNLLVTRFIIAKIVSKMKKKINSKTNEYTAEKSCIPWQHPGVTSGVTK